MSIWLRIGGYPATEIAAHTPPTWETWADGGCGSASWAFALSMTSQHQALRVGALVEVMCGPMPIWTGLMSEPDRTTWECVAYGLASDAKNYLALDSGGNANRSIVTVVNQAIASGWLANNYNDLSGSVAGDPDTSPITAATLFDQFAEELGRRWGVDAARRIFVRPDPSTPTWLTSPDSAAFGTTDEGNAGTLMGRYLDSTTSTYLTVTAGSSTPQVAVDLTERGAISAAEAQAIVDGLLVRDHAGPRWTNGVTLSREQLQTMGGTPAFLPTVRAGEMMRSLGLSNAVQALALDTVIGKTRYTAGEDSIYIEPVNTAPRSLTDVIAAA